MRPRLGRAAGRWRTLPARAGIFVIELYRQLISPLTLPSCRFIPSCSQYAVEALRDHGLVRGSWLTGVRLAKCGPWHHGGWDPVPERDTAHAADGHREAAAKPVESERCV